MGEHNELDVGIHLKSLFESDGVHIPGVALGVDEYGDAVLVNDGVDGSVEGHVGAKDALTFEGALARGGSAVYPLARGLDAKMKSRGAARKTDGVFHARLLGGDFLDGSDVFALGGYPVGVEGVLDVVEHLTVAGGYGEMDVIFERLKICFVEHFYSPKKQIK